MKLILLITIAVLAQQVYSTPTEYGTCVDACAVTADCANTADNCQYHEAFWGEQGVSGFEITECNDYMYSIADDSTDTDAQIVTKYVACIDAWVLVANAVSSPAPNTTMTAYAGCDADCVAIEAAAHVFPVDSQESSGELLQADICMVACSKQNDCDIDDDTAGACFRDLVSPMNFPKWILEFEIDACELWGQTSHFTTTTDQQASDMFGDCYAALAAYMTAGNSATADSFATEAIDTATCLDTCTTNYIFDFGSEGEGGDGGPGGDGDGGMGPPTDQDKKDCKGKYCVFELEECEMECETECGANNACLSPLQFIPINATPECKTFNTEYMAKHDMKEDLEKAFFDKYKACGDSLATLYADNAGVLGDIACRGTCISDFAAQQKKDDDDDDSAQILSICIIALLVVLF